MNPRNISQVTRWIAFSGDNCIASGTPQAVATRVKSFIGTKGAEPVLIFDAETSAVIEMDFRGSLPDVLDRLPVEDDHRTETVATETSSGKPSAGRPKLGVVAREVTLLPRHWQWLATQPGGASVTLRKLVEHALRTTRESERMRLAQEAVYKFMSAMAGNNPGFEEASRALFAHDMDRFRNLINEWPGDIRSHLLSLADAIGVLPLDKE